MGGRGNKRRKVKPKVIDKQEDYLLRWLAEAQAMRVKAEDRVQYGVVSARQLGISWRRIAPVIGMTAEGARKRWDIDEVEALAAALNAVGAEVPGQPE